MEKFKGIIDKIIGFGAMVESEPKMMGPRIIAIMAPDKKAITKAKPKKSAVVESPTT
jgi:hypothetical protein